MKSEKQLIDVAEARGYVETFLADPILKMAANAVLNNTPRVDAVEVVHGRWEKKTADCVYYYACSECGEPVPSGQWGNDFFSNYCPNCGAKMEGDGNG